MLRVFEAIIAITIVAITFIVAYRDINLPDLETVNWRNDGFNALETLDKNGLLAAHIINGDTAGLNNSLKNLMPAGVNYDTVICSNSCVQPSIDSEKITSVQYYDVGNVTHFAANRVILYMWS